MSWVIFLLSNPEPIPVSSLQWPPSNSSPSQYKDNGKSAHTFSFSGFHPSLVRMWVRISRVTGRLLYFCPSQGLASPGPSQAQLTMGILPSCLYLPLGKLSRKSPVNNLPKIYCRAAGGCKHQQMSAMHPEGTATCHVELPTKQHRPCMVPSEDLGPVHMGVHMRALISRVVCPQGCPPSQ